MTDLSMPSAPSQQDTRASLLAAALYDDAQVHGQKQALISFVQLD